MTRVPSCEDNAPRDFTGHWREWHRGHGCDKDPLQRRPEDAVACPACGEPPGVACAGPASHPSRLRAFEDHTRARREPVVRSSVADPTAIECPTCDAWVGWACNGHDYGYHAAGYHPKRRKAATLALHEAIKKIPPKVLKTMREHYSVPPDPVCPVCEAPMGIASAGGGPTIFACDGRLWENDRIVGWAPGRSANDDHYAQSRTPVYGHGDAEVIALIDAYELLQNPHGRPEAP